MLTYINNKFVNSSLKTKVELYILPLMILYLLYYFSSSLFVVEKPFVVKNKINLEEYKNKKFQGSFLDFFSNIEEKAKENNIQILSLNNKKNIVELKIQSPKEKLSLFIKQIENINKFTKITFMTMYDKKDSNKYLFLFSKTIEFLLISSSLNSFISSPCFNQISLTRTYSAIIALSS